LEPRPAILFLSSCLVHRGQAGEQLLHCHCVQFSPILSAPNSLGKVFLQCNAHSHIDLGTGDNSPSERVRTEWFNIGCRSKDWSATVGLLTRIQTLHIRMHKRLSTNKSPGHIFQPRLHRMLGALLRVGSSIASVRPLIHE
jgi:hypothetical protein